MSLLAWVCAGLTLILAAYAAGHALAVLAFLARRRTAPLTARPTDAVAVLIPARHEGDGALRVLTSLLNQDHAGPVEAWLLINDASDSSLPYLAAAFPDADLHAPADGRVVLYDANQRTLAVAFTGADPKHHKVNWAAERLTTPYVAILDCDHQAHPEWLRSAVATAQARGARAVQGRRFPLEATGLFALWDALHQHIGCELFNAAFTRLGRDVFLTGTTLLLETPLLRAHPLRDCLTEDTDLSYRLFLEGERIVADPHGGSDEEVSPDLYSFFARRRRWANGHTEAFLRHVPRLWRAPLPWPARLQFLFHGAHYLMAAVVFALHLVLGVLFLPGLTAHGVLAAGITSLGLGAWAASTQRARRKRTFTSDILILTAWLFPAVVIVFSVVTGYLRYQSGWVGLPLPAWLLSLGLAGLAMPLVLLVVGLAGFGQLTWSTLLSVCLTYPVAFYLDVSGVLIGLVDYAFGRHLWFAVARAPHAALATPRVGGALVPTHGIVDSWRPSQIARRLVKGLWMALPRLNRPATWLRWGVPLLLAVGVWAWARATRVPQIATDCTALQHDPEPWIVSLDLLGGRGYCDATADQPADLWTRPTSTFSLSARHDLGTLDPAVWDVLDDTFECNLAQYSPANARPTPGQGLTLAMTDEPTGDRAYRAAAIATKATDAERFHYGRFEVEMKPARGPGLISAFFLYRFDPWQEIDVEFLGRDTTRILLNVYYNPGAPGDTYNYGKRGTPVLVDLGFDAADAFHTYAIEWDLDEIRWFVDGRLIHRRPSGRPTPVPHLPMRLHLNVWPICSEDLAGAVDPTTLPAEAEFRSVAVYRREPAPFHRVLSWLDPAPHRVAVWQDDAGWVRRGPAIPAE